MNTTPTLALNDLFRLAFSTPVIWLSGDAAARPNLNWVVTNIDETQEGDILILTTVTNAWRTLQRAMEQGTAAVVFLGDKSPSEKMLPKGLMVVALPGQHSPQTIQRLLLTVMINQRAALMERGVQIHSQLSQVEAEGLGLAGLVGTMRTISGHGILVQDKRLAILAQEPTDDLKNDWQELVKPLELLDSLPESLRDRKLAALHGTSVEQKLTSELTRLVAPIIVGGMARGYLSLLAQTGSVTSLDGLVVEQGARVCGVEMSRTKAVREAEKRLKGDLLNALLKENISPRDAQLWAQGMGLDLTQAYVAIRFAWNSQSAPSRRRLETLVNGEVNRLGIKVIVNPMGAEVVCFCQVAHVQNVPDEAFQLAQSVIERSKNEYPDALVISGLGIPSKDIGEWRSSFRQAGQALELARRFRDPKPLYFPNLSVYRLLIQLEDNQELIAFQEEMLGALFASEGSREMIHTLEVYFEHNANLSQAADALFIHRNTLIYRMERIAGITGANLDNPETRLAMQLALHIYRMMENAGR